MNEPLRLTAAVDLDVEAAAEKPAKVSILAYSGALMRPSGWPLLGIDLAGLDATGPVQLLADHDASLNGIVGTGRAETREGKLWVSGVLSRASAVSQKIIELSRDGVQFEASVGLDVLSAQAVNEGETVALNGRSIKAPKGGFTLITAGRLREVSILPLGADPTTAVSIAAAASSKGNQSMTQNTDLSAERARVAAVVAVAKDHPDIQASAVREGWDADKTELAVLRAERDRQILNAELDKLPRGLRSAPARRGPDDGANVPAILESALLCHLGHEALAAKTAKPEVLERARDVKRGASTLVDILRAGLRMQGNDQTMGREEVLRVAFSPALQAAAGQTAFSLSGILSNTANKFLMAAFDAVDKTCLRISGRRPVKDFKQASIYRLTGDASYVEIPPDGMIPHGTLDETSYTIQADTYARLFVLDRRDIINDDLGALQSIPARLGRGAALKLNSVFWTAYLDNASFFTAPRGNLITDALDKTGATAAVEALLKAKDEDGEPLSIAPRFLLVPPELLVDAKELLTSLTTNATGTTDAVLPAANGLAGIAEPVVSPYLSNDAYTGFSTTAWYLLADPATLPTVSIAFLDGRETPVIESADTDFNTLGVQFRGYFDFGVSLQEYRAGVKSTGLT